MLEVRGVDDHAGNERRGDRSVGRRERDAERGHEQGVHLARRRGCRVDPIDRAEAGVGDVVVDVDDRNAGEQLGMPTQHRSDALEVAAVADDDEVVVDAWLRILAEAIDARHERVHLRHDV